MQFCLIHYDLLLFYENFIHQTRFRLSVTSRISSLIIRTLIILFQWTSIVFGLYSVQNHLSFILRHHRGIGKNTHLRVLILDLFGLLKSKSEFFYQMLFVIIFQGCPTITTDWVTKTTKNYFLTVLEAKSLRLKYQLVWFLLRPLSLLAYGHLISVCMHELSSVCTPLTFPVCPNMDTILIRTLVRLD